MYHTDNLLKSSPALSSLLAGSFDRMEAQQAKTEIEDYIQRLMTKPASLPTDSEGTQFKAKYMKAVDNLLWYVRLLQLMISSVVDGKITAHMRKAMVLVRDACEIHKTGLELGQNPVDGTMQHIDRMQGVETILFGMGKDDLLREVFDHIQDVRSREPDYSPFSGVAVYKRDY